MKIKDLDRSKLVTKSTDTELYALEVMAKFGRYMGIGQYNRLLELRKKHSK